MLSYEEKQAIEKIKRFNQYNWEMNNLKGKEFAKPYFESLDTLLNLIEKQSKEIEELKEEVMEKELIIDGMKEYRRIEVEEIQEQYYVSKDKIKAKIEEVKDGTFDAKIVLQSLLDIQQLGGSICK